MKAKLVQQRIYQGPRDWAEHRYKIARLLLIESKTDTRDNIALMLLDGNLEVSVICGFRLSQHDVVVKEVEVPKELVNLARRHMRVTSGLREMGGIVFDCLHQR